jgi:hypothetical protein
LPAEQPSPDFAIPLSRWADRKLRQFESEARAEAIASVSGATLLGERAALGGFAVPGKVSAGPGASKIYGTRDRQWFALTLPRPEDRDYLPALFGDERLDATEDTAIEDAVARHDCAHLLETARLLGLPVAAVDEQPVSPPIVILETGGARQGPSKRCPRVIDLSAIWAGPLAGNLLWLAGGEVVKVESRNRPDQIRSAEPGLFDLLNQGKDNVAIDFSSNTDKAALVDLIRGADIVIEASRVRALLQLGIDADALVRETPGLVWLSITGHGARGESANWTGTGHDCGVAGGLSRALAEVTREPGFVGDAIADPLTGIVAALEGWRAWQSGEAGRLALAMSALVAHALDEERQYDAGMLERELCAWGASVGQPFPPVPLRPVTDSVRPMGADTAQWLPC